MMKIIYTLLFSLVLVFVGCKKETFARDDFEEQDSLFISALIDNEAKNWSNKEKQLEIVESVTLGVDNQITSVFSFLGKDETPSIDLQFVRNSSSKSDFFNSLNSGFVDYIYKPANVPLPPSRNFVEINYKNPSGRLYTSSIEVTGGLIPPFPFINNFRIVSTEKKEVFQQEFLEVGVEFTCVLYSDSILSVLPSRILYDSVLVTNATGKIALQVRQ